MSVMCRIISPKCSNNILIGYSLYRFTTPIQQQIATKFISIDCLFDNLVQERKPTRWDFLKKEFNRNPESYFNTALTSTVAVKNILADLKNLQSPNMELNISKLTPKQIDNILLATLEVKHDVDFYDIINQCLDNNILPSDEVLVECLKYISISGRISIIERFENVLHRKNCVLLKVYNNLTPFKALASWRNDHMNNSLKYLKQFYSSPVDINGKKLLNAVFILIAEETISKKSEASLVCLSRTAEEIFKKYSDIYLLANVWKNCFISDWYSDQQYASGLHENYLELRDLISRRSSSLCSRFLRNHNTDAVHRLIEIFLKYKNLDACENCLNIFFGYQYYLKNIKGCAEIIKTYHELNLPVSKGLDRKLVNLLVNQRNVPQNKHHHNPVEYKFIYKF